MLFEIKYIEPGKFSRMAALTICIPIAILHFSFMASILLFGGKLEFNTIIGKFSFAESTTSQFTGVVEVLIAFLLFILMIAFYYFVIFLLSLIGCRVYNALANRYGGIKIHLNQE